VASRRYGLQQIAIVLGAVCAYELLRRLMTPDWPLAIRHAHEVLTVERSLHLDWESTLERAALAVPGLAAVLEVFYFASQFALTGLFFLWLYRRSLTAFQSFRNVFLAMTATALVVHWRFPTAPPRLAHLGLVHTGVGLAGISNPVAAMPSLHAGWALGVGVGLVRYGRGRWRVVGAVYPAAVVFTIVATGNHFILDVLAGFAVLGVGFTVEGVRKRRTSSDAHAAHRTSRRLPSASPEPSAGL
jgi:hypothetical protein